MIDVKTITDEKRSEARVTTKALWANLIGRKRFAPNKLVAKPKHESKIVVSAMSE